MPFAQFYGLDFGYNDPCALIEAAVIDEPGEEKKALFVNELLYETKHTSTTLIKRFEAIGVRKDITMVCDNARPEMIADLAAAGYRAVPCEKYKGSVSDGINAVQKYRLKITSHSKNTFDEISTYCWDEQNEKLLDVPADSIDHIMDAVRYGVETLKKFELKVTDRERAVFEGLRL
jgi:phage terminase large subunit